MTDFSKNILWARAALQRFWVREDGATLVEFTIVLSLFLFIFFGLIDFGRMAFHYVAAERAMHVAARVAAVRPPACPGVPQVNGRGPVGQSTIPPEFGTSCNAEANVCQNVGTISCSGNAANPSANEIWALVQGAMPNDATIANLSFSYTFDSNLGFLGGPFVPIVTVELQNLDFQFVSPLSALLAMGGSNADPNLGSNITFPSMSVSLPAEDLGLGNAG